MKIRKQKRCVLRTVLTGLLFFLLVGTVMPLTGKAASIDLEDGTYEVQVSMSGGSGRASIESPAEMSVTDRRAMVRIVFSSPYYDYMRVEDTIYYPVNAEGNSAFEIPILVFDGDMQVVADTTAMSSPHEITYTLRFDSSSVRKQSEDEVMAQIYNTAGYAVGAIVAVVLIGVLIGVVIVGRSKKKTAMMLFLGVVLFHASSCGIQQNAGGDVQQDTAAARDVSAQLIYTHSMETDYAKGFWVDYFEGDYALITVSDGSRFLVVPEGGAVPEDLAEDVTAVCLPVENIYLAATATMDMFCAMGAVDCITLSSVEENSWHIEEARTAMENGKIVYAGKYSAPDYELIKASGCTLSVQSTMLEHVPEVREQLELLGIQIFEDHSSYEEHPLGRMEWIKAYGVLTGHESEAVAAYGAQRMAFERGTAQESLGRTVAFFNVTSTGAVNIRKPNDYIAKMIRLAGGSYVFDGIEVPEGATGTMNLQMEAFYSQARDADVLIYNSTIVGELDSMEDLLALSPLFADFKAVQKGNVWCMSADFFQNSMELGTAMEDMHEMLMMTDATEEKTDGEFTFLHRLE